MTSEPLIVLIGFLGSGKTSLLRTLVHDLVAQSWQPFVILNDYQNAHLDAQWLQNDLSKTQVMPLAGSCICCSGLNDLRQALKNRPRRQRPITLIEANGTTSPVDLLAHLSIGIDSDLLPPIQLTPIDARLWQKRGTFNELEREQLSTARLVVITWLDTVETTRVQEVDHEIKMINPRLELWGQQQIKLFPNWITGAKTRNHVDAFASRATDDLHRHQHLSHWSSCEVSLPKTMSQAQLYHFLSLANEPNLRLKGCINLIEPDLGPVYFEKFADGTVRVRPFPGNPAFGSRCIAIAPAVDPVRIHQQVLEAQGFSG